MNNKEDAISKISRNAVGSSLSNLDSQKFKFDMSPNFEAINKKMDDEIRSINAELAESISPDNPDSLLGMQRRMLEKQDSQIENQKRQLAKQ